MNHFVLISAVIILVSCATTNINTTVVRPTEINLSNRNRVVVAEITPALDSLKYQKHSVQIANQLSAILLETNRFEVIDQEHLNSLLAEHKLKLSGMVGNESITQLGNITGATVLLYSYIDRDEYSETKTQGNKWIDKNGYEH